jgi:uncharacterized membrane protein
VRPNDSGLPGQIDDAIESIAELERKALAGASLHQRAIERFTLAVGRPRTVYLILCFVALWAALNVILPAMGRQAFDAPPFYWLDGILALAALLMTIFILTTENRMSEIDEQRSRLHLQISMLAERKAAKIVQLLEELRYDMPSVANREDREAAAMSLATNPHEVAEELERRTPNRGELPQD